MCKPGYRYPPWQYGPFLGIEIDSATEEEYRNGFDCVPVERMLSNSVNTILDHISITDSESHLALLSLLLVHVIVSML